MMDRKMQMAVYAYKNTALYHDRWSGRIAIDQVAEQGNWEEIPCIEKKDLVFAGTRAISKEHMGKYATDRLLRTHTSGTSGICLSTYWDKGDYLASLLPLWMERWKVAKVHPKDRVCFFNTVLPRDLDCIQEENSLIFSKSGMTERRLEEIYGMMQEYSPRWLLFHPGMAMLFCDLVEKKKMPPLSSLRYIEVTGEMILGSQIERLEQIFSCTVRSHYGTMEVSSIGYEEDEGLYRLFESSTYLEILDDSGKSVEDGTEGNIYVTSLHNHAMPVIRYGLGDRGRIIRKQYKQKEVRFLQLCKARKNDLLYMPDGDCIQPDGLLKPVEYLNGAEDVMVLQFRAIQERRDLVRLHIILDSDYEERMFADHYMRLLDERMKDGIRYEFVFRGEKLFPDRLTGKLGWFESRCGGGTGVEKNKDI